VLPLALLRPALRPIVAAAAGASRPLQLDLARGRSGDRVAQRRGGARARLRARAYQRALVDLLNERLARPGAALDGAVRALARTAAR
jgi:hypothetical protein